MNLPAPSSETSFFPSSAGDPFADAKRESANRLVSGVERSNIDNPLKVREILSSSMMPSDNPISHEWSAVGRPYSPAWLPYVTISHAHFVSQTHHLYSTELPYSVLQHGENSVSALSAEELLAGRIYQAMQNRVGGFLRYSTPAESASFEGLMFALKMKGFNESVAEVEMLCSTDDLDPGDKPLSLESVRGFVKLIDAFRDLGEPMVGRFSAGTLSVEWRIADDKHLLVEPLDGDNASFALIGPSLSAGEDEFCLNGRGKIADVVAALRNHQVDRWHAW